MFLLLLTHCYCYYYYYHHHLFLADVCCIRDQFPVPVHVFIQSPVSPGNKIDLTFKFCCFQQIFALKTVLLLLHGRTTS